MGGISEARRSISPHPYPSPPQAGGGEARWPSRLLAILLLAASLALPAFAAGKLGLGRPAHPDEIAAWDTDVRPDGQGLPAGKGTVKEGEALFLERCASCHGEFGEGAGRWPPIAGGRNSLKGDNPEKTVGSFWPYTSTAFDYIKRSMPYGNARSLTDDEVYALVAFILNMNDLVPETFELSRENFPKARLPNEANFYDDDRETTERHFWNADPCMKNCKPDTKVTGRARVLDVTPEDGSKGMKVD